ncbi:hypothetical protein AB1Y20_000390 [Prymnesium parvum]|uniref:Cryptochrome DASH n=1 Tax=Prymnesium parvum TaxID=97485 RepID=A0AB34K4K4_PRYPA
MMTPHFQPRVRDVKREITVPLNLLLASTSCSMPATRHRFIWFCRNDLRLHDNPCLAKIASYKGDFEVLPVYLFDPRHFGTTRRGSPKTADFRARFLYESVVDLRSSLRAVGSGLLVGVGKPEEVLPLLVAPREEGKPATTTTILCQEQVTSEELKVDRALRGALPSGTAQLTPVWGGTLYDKCELPFRADLSDLPDVFTPFRNKVESRAQVRAPLSSPKVGTLPLPAADRFSPPSGLGFDAMPLPRELGMSEGALTAPPDPRGVLPMPGGEEAALRRLQHYLWGTDSIATYFETRNGMLGADYSSKFAPWLAHGCLSPRQVAHELAKYESQRVKNKSTYWMLFELIWRDFFRLYCAKHGRSIFMEGGPIRSLSSWRDDPELLSRWKHGTLGVPLVDANMRELAATGFMSNRGRQNVASYLALDLQLDWRYGADHFESLLVDYDVCSNWGNWVAAAGLTGGRINRFNIVKQSKDYDPDGSYVRHWVPELKDVPAPFVHEPWKLSRQDQERYGVRIGAYGAVGVDYPTPPRSKFQYSTSGDAREGQDRKDSRYHRDKEPLPASQADIRGRAPGKARGRGTSARGTGRKRVQHGALSFEPDKEQE